MVRIYQGHERSRSIHVQPRLSVIVSAFVLVIYDVPYVCVGIIGQAFNPTKEIQNVPCNGIVEGRD